MFQQNPGKRSGPYLKFKTPLHSIYLQSVNSVQIQLLASTLGEHDQCSKLNELAIIHAILVFVIQLLFNNGSKVLS